jgi:hypothetical protein
MTLKLFFNQRNFNQIFLTSSRFLSDQKSQNDLKPKNYKAKKEDDEPDVKVYSTTVSKYVQNLIEKVKNRGKEKKDDDGEERKGPFKNYYQDEERSKKSIQHYEEYFDKNCKKKDRENFMVLF